jgi:hypothetical protein
MTLTSLCAVCTLGINLSTRMLTVWHRCKAKVNRLLHDAPPEAWATHESTRPFPLPYEIMDMIAHLTRSLDTLKACSLTCRSWYTVVVPHLHHTLTLKGNGPIITRGELKSLSRLHELGLIPLVKEIRMEHRNSFWLHPQAFSSHDLHYFSTFANVQTLKIRALDIGQFMPGIEQYFEHFSPTLRSITLYHPVNWTPRQLSHLLSLFSNLDDIEIWGFGDTPTSSAATPDTELVPPPAPKLRGRLTLYNFSLVETWTHLITLCDGLRFRHMDLAGSAGCAPVLLEACAETLETLRFNRGDALHGELFRVNLSTDSS